MKKDRPKAGFDTDRYLKHQITAIKRAIRASKNRLYIEFGGKIVNDKHAARVLPGYREDTKLELIKKLLPKADLIFVISSRDIMRKRVRGDYGITYDKETIRTINELKHKGIAIHNVAISLLDPNAPIPSQIRALQRALCRKGITPYLFFAIKDYPSKRLNLNSLQINPFIPLKRQFVLIVSPGGGSGKFGICLNQLYHEMHRKNTPYYLKFETFPVHDLPVRHPLNLAYMAASADFYDVVMKDTNYRGATSYKRDLENYGLLAKIAMMFPKEGKHLQKLTSATNMGVNSLSKGIIDHESVEKEAAAEIARRLIRYKHEVQAGKEDAAILARVRTILKML